MIAELKTFEKTVTEFDAAQGGIFEARFDNELLGKTSTLDAEIQGMIKGLQTGNAALVTAAAEQMHANAADVGGNNVPVTGGTYNTDGLTVADVLSTAAAVADAAAAGHASSPATTPPAAPQSAPPPPAADQPAPMPAAGAGDGVVHHDAAHLVQHPHHFEHMWS